MCKPNKYHDINDFLVRSYHLTSDIILEEDSGNIELREIVHISQVMLHRLQEQINTAFQLLKNGNWASLEAILRVCIEYSIQIAYLFEKDTKERFGKYFYSFFSEMEKRQVQMINAFKDEPDIQNELKKSKQILSTRKTVIERYCNHCGIPFTNEEKISFFEMCRELGQEKLYRELYSRLSNVVHADADSLIDYISIYCIQHTEEQKRIAAIEVQEWILNYFLRIVLLYNSTHSMFLDCFQLNSRIIEFEKLQNGFLDTYKKYTDDFTIIGKNA